MANENKALGCAVGIGQILLAAPLWYYLLYQILVRVEANVPMWVCYWLYVPLGLVLGLAGKVVEALDD